MLALIDCNNFFVSCERVFQPGLKNTPVVVLSNNDGCIISRSQEAKDLGIKMGEPLFKARPIIEQAGVRVFSSNFMLYGDMSQRVMQTLKKFGAVEVYSIDEAFVDLSHVPAANLEKCAATIREIIYQYLGLPVCVGIAPTKTLAKAANHLAKKNPAYNGTMLLDTPAKQAAARRHLAVENIWGVGRRYAAKLHQHQVYTVADLVDRSSGWVYKHLGGVVGVRLRQELLGQPCQELSFKEEHVRKNIACTRSFSQYITTLNDLQEAVATYTSRAAEKLRRQRSAAKAITVFIRTNKFSVQAPQYHRATTVSLPLASADTGELIRYALQGLQQIYQPGYSYKKAGVILSEIIPEHQVQTDLFHTTDRSKSQKLMQALDKLNTKMSKNEWAINAVGYAAAGIEKDWKMIVTRRSPRYTTHWQEILEINI
ncbi:SOS mutagenesis and repair protein UmuC [Adhaeribacter aerolatus]|uniref:SOS mutagenesis and repair protein UmuC n=1 Tax=Adhaeribacter aerolatus TaxID=670289 RepID=A0A512B2J0_9BACT|nr:Y-family DNA polymerase [Adhaeribacter aerolatus]GEO06170.1 SOS mutagenesis and repair protein UmuC [Adhaeribacter aerolatus]